LNFAGGSGFGYGISAGIGNTVAVSVA